MADSNPPQFNYVQAIMGLIFFVVMLPLFNAIVVGQTPTIVDYRTTFVVVSEKPNQKVILKRVTAEGKIDEYYKLHEAISDKDGKASFSDIFVPSTWEISVYDGSREKKKMTYKLQRREPVHTLKIY